MRPARFLTRFIVDQPKERVFGWHLQNGSFARSFPSWEGMGLVKQEELPGHQFRFFVKFFWKTVVFRSIKSQSQNRLQLKMEKGPLYLDYEMEVREQGKEACELIEKVEFLLRMPWFFGNLRKRRFEYRLQRLLAYKQEVLVKDLAFSKRYPSGPPLKILISGTSGLIGSNLVNFLETLGHDVWHLVRSKGTESEKSILLTEREKLEGFDVVVHLGGQNINKRWTRKVKHGLLTSRVESTKMLTKIIASLQSPPKVFLCASAVGFYGNTGNHTVEEGDPKGEGFLADLCETWENSSKLLTTLGIRVVNLRFGMVLSSYKGALKKLLPFFRWNLGSILGTGEQYMSWISIDDVAPSIYHIMMTKEIVGPINIVSPEPVTNREFTEALAKHLHKHLGPQLKPSLLRLLKGQMADEVLLSSTKANPKRLLESGYHFYYPNLQEALPHLIY